MKEHSAGGVIVNGKKVIVVAQQMNTYSLPKGHLDDGENPLDAAYREIHEETGLTKNDLRFVKELETYNRCDGKSGRPKDIHMFLFKTDKEELRPVDKDNPEAKWVDVSEVADHLSYPEDRNFFLRHLKEYEI